MNHQQHEFGYLRAKLDDRNGLLVERAARGQPLNPYPENTPERAGYGRYINERAADLQNSLGARA